MNVTSLRSLDRKDCLPLPGYERHEEYVPSTPEKKSYVWGFLFVLLLAGVIGQGVYSWRLSNRVAELESVVQIQISSQKDAMRSEVDPTKDQLGSHPGEVLKTVRVPDRLARQQQESPAPRRTADSVASQCANRVPKPEYCGAFHAPPTARRLCSNPRSI